MKQLRTILSLTTLLVVVTVQAQQVPLYSQYYFNKFIYNPALTGHSGNTEANLFGRNQYIAIDGYQTAGAALSSQLNDGNIGVGVYLINDASLFQTQNSVYGNYAYNINLGGDNILSLGLAAGLVSNRFNTDNFYATDPDDPALQLLNNRPGAVLDASVGANLKLKDFNFGVSVPQFLGATQEFQDYQQSSILYDLQNHLMVMTSYDIHVNDDLVLQPLVLYKNTRNAPGQVDFNVIADWTKKGWLGFGVRDGYGITAMAGVRVAEKARIGYSYDWSNGAYSQALGGSHELLLGLSLNNKSDEDEKAKKEEFDKFKKDIAKKHNDDLKEQEKRIADLEDELDRVKSLKREKDTVVIVSKPAPNRTERPKSGDDKTNGDQKISGQFMVVAGSFSEEKNATVYFNRLVNKGLSPYVYRDKNTNVNYVHLGRFYFKEEARKFAKENTGNGVKLWVKTLAE